MTRRKKPQIRLDPFEVQAVILWLADDWEPHQVATGMKIAPWKVHYITSSRSSYRKLLTELHARRAWRMLIAGPKQITPSNAGVVSS